MALVLWFGSELLPDWSTGSMLSRFGRLLILVVAGIVTYFVSLLLLGLKLKQFLKRID